MKEYNIDGFVLKISDEQLNDFEWSRQFAEAKKEFIEKYEGKYKHYDYEYNENGEKKTIIDILDKIVDDFAECSTSLLSRIIDDARKHDIYDMTAQSFADSYVEHSTEDFEGLQKVFDQIDEVYNKMTGNHMERQINNASRGRIVGGGFGLSGAVKGMVTASVMNSVADAFYEKKMENAEADDYRECMRMLDRIKKSDSTWDIIIECIHNYVFNIMWGYKKLQESWGKIIKSSIDSDKCEALLSSALAVPEKAREIGLQALEADPTNHKVYEFLLTVIGDRNNELEKAALEIANFDLHKLKLYMIEKVLLAFDFTKLDNYSRFYETIYMVSEMYCLKPDKYINCVEKVEKSYEESKYFFGGKKYDTTDEALQAKEDNDKFCEYVKNIDWNKEDDLKTLISWLESELKSDLKDRYIEDVKGKLDTVSKNHRTVNGVEYESVEKAENIRNAYGVIKTIIDKEYKTVEELSLSKDLLDGVQDEELLNNAQTIIEEIQKCFDLCNSTMVDVSNIESRVEMNKIVHNAIMTKRAVNEFNVYESKFEDWYKATYNSYLTVNGTETMSTIDADKRYFETIEKAVKYKEYLVKNAEQPEKKGFFSKIASGVKDVLQKGNETAYNWITVNGTKEIPVISVEDMDAMLSNDKVVYSSNNETLKLIDQIKKAKTNINKIKVNIDAYRLEKAELNKEELRNYINSKCECCALAPVRDKNKKLCYNVSLSSGTYAVTVKNADLGKNIDLSEFGLYDINARPFDKEKSIIVEGCGKQEAKTIADNLRNSNFTSYEVDLKYMLTQDEIKKYKILNYDAVYESKGKYYVILKYKYVQYSSSLVRLVDNHKIVSRKFKLFDNDGIHNYGDNYVILAMCDDIGEAKIICEKMLGKALLGETESLDESQCEFKILFDSSNCLAKKLNVNSIDTMNYYEDDEEDSQEDFEDIDDNSDDSEDELEITEAQAIHEQIEDLEKLKTSGKITLDEYMDELDELVDYVNSQFEKGIITKDESNRLTEILFDKLGI